MCPTILAAGCTAYLCLLSTAYLAIGHTPSSQHQLDSGVDYAVLNWCIMSHILSDMHCQTMTPVSYGMHHVQPLVTVTLAVHSMLCGKACTSSCTVYNITWHCLQCSKCFVYMSHLLLHRTQQGLCVYECKASGSHKLPKLNEEVSVSLSVPEHALSIRKKQLHMLVTDRVINAPTTVQDLMRKDGKRSLAVWLRAPVDNPKLKWLLRKKSSGWEYEATVGRYVMGPQ